jgi:hypothetical protein
VPYGAPVSVPSARVDLTKFALKNLTRFTGLVGEPALTPHAFLKYAPCGIVNDGAASYPARIIMNSTTANDLTYSEDFGLSWATVAVGGPAVALEFQFNAALDLDWFFLVDAVGIRRRNGTTAAVSTVRASVNNLNDIASADKRNYGLNADGISRTTPTMIAVGDNCAVERSTDGGLTWATIAIGGAGTEDFHSVISNGAGRWIAVGLTAALVPVLIVSTDDGLTWTFSNPLVMPSKVYYAMGKFIGIANVAGTAQILTSVNGLDWEIAYSQAGWRVNDINYDQNSIVIAAGDAGQMLVTRDLMNFERTYLPESATFMTPGNGQTTLFGIDAINIHTLFFGGSFTNKDHIFSDNRWFLSVTNEWALNFRTWGFGSSNVPDAG